MNLDDLGSEGVKPPHLDKKAYEAEVLFNMLKMKKKVLISALADEVEDLSDNLEMLKKLLKVGLTTNADKLRHDIYMNEYSILLYKRAIEKVKK